MLFTNFKFLQEMESQKKADLIEQIVFWQKEGPICGDVLNWFVSQ